MATTEHRLDDDEVETIVKALDVLSNSVFLATHGFSPTDSVRQEGQERIKKIEALRDLLADADDVDVTTRFTAKESGRE